MSKSQYVSGKVRTRVSLGKLPDPPKEYSINFPTLDGGMNIYDLDYRLKPNESPYMKNLRWKDGALGCRPGQVRLIDPEDTSIGFAAFDDLFWGHCFVHVDGELLCYDPKAESPSYTTLHTGVPQNRGTWFRYGEKLMYKNRGGYYQISYNVAGTTPATMFTAAALGETGFVAEIPIIVINADPTTAAGSLYQPENRLSFSREVWYNAQSGVTQYHLPEADANLIQKVTVDGVEKHSPSDYTFYNGVVTFTTAPPVTDPPTNNTVRITYAMQDEDPTSSPYKAYHSVMDCPYAVVYGGDQNLCVVVGGCPAQPNAYFWNGNDELVMRPAYFPMEHYNFAGDTESAITGFGKQQGLLVVFGTKGVGKATFGTTTTSTDRLQIEMPYTAINSKIGCEYPWSIQLVENNLVFCNREHGVCILLDSSAALENNIEHISTKVNGSDARHGLLWDVTRSDENAVYSTVYDDEYWIVANGNAYAWDFELSNYADPTWFPFTNIQGVSFTHHADDLYHLDAHGGASKFLGTSFSDYDEAIDKVYRFAVQNFGTYDMLKDVVSMIFVVRSDTNTVIDIEYRTDYENRFDLTPIKSYSWTLVPRDLSVRFLGVLKYGHVERRRPFCRHVRHFTVELSNNDAGADLSVVSAQIFYNFQGRQR